MCVCVWEGGGGGEGGSKKTHGVGTAGIFFVYSHTLADNKWISLILLGMMQG